MFWIGLQKEGPYVKWAKLHKKNKKIYIDQLTTTLLSEDVKQLYFGQTAKEENSFSLISGIDTSELLLRELKFSLQNKRKIIKSIPFQIEAQIPYPLEESVIFTQISLDKGSKTSRASLFITRIKSLTSHIEFWQKHHIDPEEISCIPTALCRFIRQFFPGVIKSLVFHIGEQGCSATYLMEDKVLFSHAFFINTTLLEKEPIQIEKEIKRLFAFLLIKIQEGNIEIGENNLLDVIVLGNTSSLFKLKELLIAHLPLGMRLLNSPLKYNVDSSAYQETLLENYAIPIGLALDGIKTDGLSTQFRKKIFSSNTTIKKRAKAFTFLALSSLVLTLTVTFLGKSYIAKKQNSLISYFQSAVSPKSSIHNLDELEEKIEKLELSMKKQKIPYALTPSFPSVSEVLAYLSTLPPSFKIQNISYQLIKHPKIGSSKTPYLGKVTVQAEITDKKEASEIQKILSKENPLVEKGRDFSWEQNNSTYHISFFLHPKLGPSS